MRLGLIVAAVTAALVLGGTSNGAIRQSALKGTHSAALLAQVKVAASNFKFALSKKSAKSGIVSFKVTNVGAQVRTISRSAAGRRRCSSTDSRRRCG